MNAYMDRNTMANRRLSWMDQISSPTAQRRSSRIDQNTLYENSREAFSSSPASSSSPQPSNSGWAQSGPWSNLRATAAIWTPQLSSSELEESAISDEYFDELENKFASATIEDLKDGPPTPAASPGIPSNIEPFSWPNNEAERAKGVFQRKPSTFADTSPDPANNPRRIAGPLPQYSNKRADSTSEPGHFISNVQSGDGLSLKQTTSAPPVIAQRGKGLPELRTTSLSDFRLEDVQGPLATDDSVYAVVEFKLFRAEVYQLRRDWIGGDESLCLVIVEADRGIDLGKVSHIGADPKVAREVKRNLNRKHWSALLQNSATSKPSDEESEIAFQQVYEWTANSPFAGGFTAGDGTMPPRSIVRRATRVEIAKLQAKEGFEEKARRLCWQKAKEHGFTMEILGAEFQFDHQKLTFYFLAPGYVAFNPLINELYKLFKTRIWFVPLNPASFVNPSATSHSHSSSSGSGAEGLWNNQHTGMIAPKNIRRDSRQHPAQQSPLSPTSMARPPANVAGFPGLASGPTQPNPWSNVSNPKRTGAPGNWQAHQGFGVPPQPPGPRLWK